MRARSLVETIRRWPRGIRARGRSGREDSSARSPRLPSFLCLGAQKAGTTSLQELLSRHPQVFLPRLKEVQYFTLHSDRDPTWYAGAYAEARENQRCGDITPYYLFHPAAPARIKSLLPGVRLVVLVREPVERALSGYFHSRRLREERLSIEHAFAAEDQRLAGADEVLRRPGGRHRSHQMHSYLSRSRYEVQIRRYLDHFDSSQILLIRSEDLFADPASEWDRLLPFLGLDSLPLPGPIPHANRGRSEATRVDERFRSRLRERLEPTYVEMEAEHGIRW